MTALLAEFQWPLSRAGLLGLIRLPALGMGRGRWVRLVATSVVLHPFRSRRRRHYSCQRRCGSGRRARRVVPVGRSAVSQQCPQRVERGGRRGLSTPAGALAGVTDDWRQT